MATSPPLSYSQFTALGGNPLGDAGVTFLPCEIGHFASGTTNRDGMFELMTVNAVGAAGGKLNVVNAKRKYFRVKPGEPPAPGGLRVEWYSLKKYASPAASGVERVTRRI
jgi:hypothetical protein